MATLAPLQYTIEFGKSGEFWAFNVGDSLFEIMQAPKPTVSSATPTHVAFRVANRKSVDDFI